MRSQTCQQLDMNRCGKEVVQSPFLRLVYFVEKQVRPWKTHLLRSLKPHDRRPRNRRVNIKPSPQLKAGDRVRVKSKEEILATLDRRNRRQGLGFMDGMWKYCGQIHTVRKPVRKIVDENVYREKAVRRVVILDGLFCEGTAAFPHCDRTCYFFWKEVWLEKVG